MMVKRIKKQIAAVPFYSSVKAKLILAVAAAALTSLTSELSRYTCEHYTWKDITQIHWTTIVLGSIVQAVIAWRAFIDGSAQKQREQILNPTHSNSHDI
jgi:hypothetical protein